MRTESDYCLGVAEDVGTAGSPNPARVRSSRRELRALRPASHADSYVALASTWKVKLVIVISGRIEAYPASRCTTT